MKDGCPINSTDSPLKSINFEVLNGTKVNFNQFAFVKSDTSKYFIFLLVDFQFRLGNEMYTFKFQSCNDKQYSILRKEKGLGLVCLIKRTLK